MKKRSIHHIVPKSRGGKNGLENLIDLTVRDHQFYHALFENKLPVEIIDYLVNDYWNGQWEHVDEAYCKYKTDMDVNYIIKYISFK